MITDTKKCLICKKSNQVLHWHSDEETGSLWVYCVGKCQRAYTVYEYTAKAGLSLAQFLQNDFVFTEAPPNEVQKMDWPRSFIPLYDERAKAGVEYLTSRGIEPDDGMYYDTQRKGIAFPYFYDSIYCGAQIRFLETWTDDNGDERKIDTVPGTRLGLLFYNWNQQRFRTNIKGVIVTEGAFNALAIQQALQDIYGGMMKCPWLCVALSGSGASGHHLDTLKELKDNGTKIILAPDSDKAGRKMMSKFIAAEALTHYALTNNQDLDWNDIAKAMSKKDFARWFIGNIIDANA